MTNEPAPAQRLNEIGSQQVLERRLRDVVRNGQWNTVSQPIASIENGGAVGFEALTRPIGEPPLESPAVFLALASKLGLARRVEAAWRTAALWQLGSQLPKGALLFLNASPLEFTEGTLRAQTLSHEVRTAGLTPERVVLEITEGDRIHDFASLRRSLGAFRSAGFQIAIDDVGAGPSSLQAIAELRPHFIKLDRWLATDIAFDDARRAVVESMVTLARRVRAEVVAEGVETAEQLRAFASLGVSAVQGYFVGLPQPGLEPVAPAATEAIGTWRADQQARLRNSVDTVDAVATQPVIVPSEMLGRELVQVFENDRDLAAVVTLDGIEIGVITRDRLLRTFAEQFGLAIYGRRTIAALSVPATMIVPATSIREAARLALARRTSSRNDPVVIADGTEVLGIVDTLDLLEAALQEEVLEAREANPLTGLPGNRRIRQYIEKLTAEQRAPLVVIYADIDHFKQFNDRFGFGAGDLAISQLAELLQEAVRSCPNLSFVGHIGGDDFLLVVHRSDLPVLRAQLTARLATAWFDPGAQLECDRVTVTFAAAHLATLHGRFEDQAERLAHYKAELKLAGGDRFGILPEHAVVAGRAA